MKKEKTVRTYQRRTKTGKIVTVRQHTASYEAGNQSANGRATRKNEYKDFSNHGVLDILHKGGWEDFENNFEEGWTDNPECPILARQSHHLQVSAAVARDLADKYESNHEFEKAVGFDRAEKIRHQMYASKAKKMFPNDTIHYGDEQGTKNFWAEREVLKRAKQAELEGKGRVTMVKHNGGQHQSRRATHTETE